MKLKSIHLLQGTISQEAASKIKIGKGAQAFVCEGRPSLDAGRQISRVLLKKRITPTMISDNMAGFLFFKGLVKEVMVACHHADRHGALCDTGALILAVLAYRHKVPLKFLKAEHKTRFLGDPQAILRFEGKQIAPKGTQGYVPLVEWVPIKYLK